MTKHLKQSSHSTINPHFHLHFYLYLGFVIVSILIMIFVTHNHFLYDSSIIKITELENVSSEDISDESITQYITGIVQNGEYKGLLVSVENKTSYSGVFDETIHSSSELFLSITASDSDDLTATITGIKRDKYIMFLLLLFMNLLLIVGGKKGIKTCFSLLVNILLLLTALYLFINGVITISIFFLFVPIAILFIISSLLICNGVNRKTLAAILSSIISLFLSFLLAFTVLNHYKTTIMWGNIEYIDLVRDYEGIFYLIILLSGLGAIMDIAITMSSSLNEILEKNPRIPFADLKHSGQEISKDILGTMINVMLYTCYIWIIPLIILAYKNSMSIIDAIENFGQIEMVRVLTSSISIVLAIPISLYVSLWILKGGNHND